MGKVLYWLLMTCLPWLAKVMFHACRWLLIFVKFITRNIIKVFRAKPTTHGSACFASPKDVCRLPQNSLRNAGLIAGTVAGQFLRFTQEGYMLVVAKTRSGKGAGIVVPNLLSYPGSCIVNDIKGENAAITKRKRSEFGPVYHMDLEQPMLSTRFNPLDMVRFGTPHATDDALQIAQLLHLHDPAESKHWNDKSIGYIAAFILYVLEKHHRTPALRTLMQVRVLVTQTDCDFADTLQEMTEYSQQPFVRSKAQSILNMGQSPELRSIISTMEKATALFNHGGPASYLVNTSDFDLTTFNSTPQTLYMSVPEEKLGTYGLFLRLMQGCAQNAIIRAAKREPAPEHRTLFMLDELAALGPLPMVRQAAGFIASYATMVMVFQDLGQMEDNYGKKGAQTLMANAGCLVTFGVNDYDTAALLSKNLGPQTIVTQNNGQSQSWNEVLASRHNSGESVTGRPLLDPSEILRLPKNEVLIFMRDDIPEPIRATKVRYYEDEQFTGQYDTWSPIAPVPAPVATPVPAATAGTVAPAPAAGSKHQGAFDILAASPPISHPVHSHAASSTPLCVMTTASAHPVPNPVCAHCAPEPVLAPVPTAASGHSRALAPSQSPASHRPPDAEEHAPVPTAA